MKKQRRPGLSMFEVMVVMVILVIISAISFPSMASMYGAYKMNASVDAVRAAWAEARARAIEEGRPYRFAVEPSGSAYRVAPDNNDYWQGGNGPANDPLGQGLILEHSLPPGMRFSMNGEAVPDAPAEPDGNVLKEKPVTATNWTSAIVFLPDGTARDDVTITFHMSGARTTSLQLRGLTGNVSVQQDK